MSFHVLFFLPVLYMLLLCGLLSRQIVGKLCTCYLSLCSIFLSHNILFVAPGLVLPLFHFHFLLLRVSPFDSQSNVSSSLISCPSIFIMCCPYINLFFPFFFRDSPNLAFVCCIPSCFAPLFSLGWPNSCVIFAAVLIIEFVFG